MIQVNYLVVVKIKLIDRLKGVREAESVFDLINTLNSVMERGRGCGAKSYSTGGRKYITMPCLSKHQITTTEPIYDGLISIHEQRIVGHKAATIWVVGPSSVFPPNWVIRVGDEYVGGKDAGDLDISDYVRAEHAFLYSKGFSLQDAFGRSVETMVADSQTHGNDIHALGLDTVIARFFSGIGRKRNSWSNEEEKDYALNIQVIPEDDKIAAMAIKYLNEKFPAYFNGLNLKGHQIVGK